MINKILHHTVYAAAPPLPAGSKGLGCGGDMGLIADFLCGLEPGDTVKVGVRLNAALSGIIGFMTIVAGLWFMIQLITAGYGWISAGGDKHNIEMARDKIVNAVIGLIIVVVAWVIVGLLGKIIGLDILNPGAVLEKLGI